MPTSRSSEVGFVQEMLDVGMVGREGVLGAQLALGVTGIPLHALVQGAGTARRIKAAPFRRELAASLALQRALNRYLYVLMAHSSPRPPPARASTASARGSRAGC